MASILVDTTGKDRIIDVYPATALQAALIAQNDLDNTSYVNQMVVLLKNSVEESRFAKALSQVAKKHDILRTRFIKSAMGIYLGLQADLSVEIMRHADLEEYCKQDMLRGFHQDDKSWLRACLVSDRDKDYLVLTIHHVLYDGWCLDLLVQDIWKAYEGTMDETYIPFKRAIEYFEHQDSSASLDYWKQYLSGCEFLESFRYVNATVESPLEFAVAPIKGSISLDVGMVQKRGLTLATVCKAAWALTLRAYTKREDLVFGSVVSGRDIGIRGIES
jgi:hypothetical protein